MSKETIASELSRIQKSLHAPKGQYNKFGGYKYRSCEDILEALKPLLGGCFIRLEDDIVLVGERFYVKSVASLSNGDGQVSASAFAREPANRKGMDESQITGSASSYARKYALNGLLCIDDARDADTYKPDAAAPPRTPPSKPPAKSGPVNKEDKDELWPAYLKLRKGTPPAIVKAVLVSMGVDIEKLDKWKPESMAQCREAYDGIVELVAQGSKDEG